MRNRALGLLVGLAVASAGACAAGSGSNPAGPSADCGGGLVFSVLPVPFSAIANPTVIGNMGPPVHTIPPITRASI